MLLASGTKFQGLTILQHCGGGAFGEVYYCQDLTGQRLALKVCSKGVRNDKTWQRELKGLINYRKVSEDLPGLLKIFHVKETEDFLYYTMEPADMVERGGVCRADTLALRLQEGSLPAQALLPVLETILQGIVNLHQAGIAHRDIKPENILFVKGVPKLADMGLVSSISTLSSLAGTLDFIPPEIRSGSSSSSTGESYQRNDLYAFGKLIYCCISGKTANEFPHIPYKAFDLPVVKYLSRLSLRLCEGAPLRRLTSLSVLQEEFSRIRRIAEHGENFRDRFHYFWHSLWLHATYGLQVTASTLKRHWLFFLSFCLALLGIGWLMRPASQDPSQVTTRLHENPKIGYSAEIPESWLCLSSEEMYQQVLELESALDEEPPETPEEAERLQLLLEAVKNNEGNLANQETFICNMDSLGNQSESVNVVRYAGQAEAFFGPSEEMVLFDFMGRLNDNGFTPKNGKISSVTFNGLPCRVIEYSLIPGFTQNYVCFFQEGEDLLLVELSCTPPNYLQLKAQVEAMLHTFRLIPRVPAP